MPACLLGPFTCLRFSHLSVSFLAFQSTRGASGRGRSQPPSFPSAPFNHQRACTHRHTHMLAHTPLASLTADPPYQLLPLRARGPDNLWPQESSYGGRTAVAGAEMSRTWVPCRQPVEARGPGQPLGPMLVRGAEKARSGPAREARRGPAAGPDLRAWASLGPSWAGSSEGSAGFRAAGHGVRARLRPPSWHLSQDHVGHPSAPLGTDGSPECHEAGAGLPHPSPIRTLAGMASPHQPGHRPACLLPLPRGHQVAGSGERASNPG